MKKNINNIKLLYFLCLFVFVCMLLVCTSNVNAAPKLSSKKIVLRLGQAKTLKLKGTKKKAKWTVISGKKVVKLSSKKKKSVRITGKKKGTAKVQAKVGKKKYICKVVVKNNDEENPIIEKDSFSKNRTLKVGDKLVVYVSNEKNRNVSWYLSNYEYLRIENSDRSKIELTGLNSGKVTLTAKVGAVYKKCEITIEEKYTYSLTPLMAPFNQYYYLKTEDPDPYDLSFVDQSSIYSSDENMYMGIYPVKEKYCDVKYENEDYLRVKGGYIFRAQSFYLDGGYLKMMRTVSSDSKGYCEYTKNTDANLSPIGLVSTESEISVYCPPVENYIQFLIDNYAAGTGSFFDKMDNVQKELAQIYIYPKAVADDSMPNTAMPYPFLAASPYEELPLNEHYEMYQRMSGGLLAQEIYPFILDSASFPSTMATVARMLEPGCVVKSTEYHWEIAVSYNGETRYYGEGSGGSAPILKSMADSDFLFDGSDNDMATHATVDILAKKLKAYSVLAYNNAKQYDGLLYGKTFDETVGKGNWIRIGKEPYYLDRSPDKGYAYATTTLGSSQAHVCSDVWVDGRYIGLHEIYERGAKYEEHPNATIILQNQSYTTVNGDVKTGDMAYYYYSEDDTWRAYYEYNDAGWYTVGMELPDQFILTRSQVDNMNVDRNTDFIPEHGLIYDSTEYPGTPF